MRMVVPTMAHCLVRQIQDSQEKRSQKAIGRWMFLSMHWQWILAHKMFYWSLSNGSVSEGWTVIFLNVT